MTTTTTNALVPVKQAAVQLATITALKRRVTKLEAELKTRVASQLDVGDRKTATLPDGSKIATISVTEGSFTAKVIDEAAFLAWVRQTRPTAIVETVRDSDRRQILAAVKNSGELPPGVDMVPGESYVSVRQDERQQESIALAWADGRLNLSSALTQALAPSIEETAS